MAKQTPKGEPRTAMIISGVIVVLALFLRDLNVIAPLITMFFLITYGMINLVVFIEQSLGLVSFRPLLRIPRILPLIGALGCLFAMFVIAPAFSLAAIALGPRVLRPAAAPPVACALWRRAQRPLRGAGGMGCQTGQRPANRPGTSLEAQRHGSR